MKYIAKAPIARLIRDHGGQRVSDDITDEIGTQVENLAIKLAKKAILVARLQEAKTVKRKHLIVALEMEKQKI